jgi:hypothetical protein
MAHPIFDRTTYPFDRPEAKALYETLIDVVPQPKEIVEVFVSAGGESGSLLTPQAPRDLWRDALNGLAAANGIRKLCMEVLPGIHRLKQQTLLTNAIAAVVAAVPMAERRVIDGVPVLDRQPLRDMVASLESDLALRVLLVRGGPKTGKTHGRLVFLAAAEEAGAASVYLYAPQVATVADVIWYLFDALDAADELPECDTTGPAWYAEVCRRLGTVARRRERVLWVAIDDLAASEDGAPLLDPEIAAFCQQFVLQMPNPAFGKWFRLMLIHYPDGAVPTRWLRDVWAEDRPEVGSVQQEHVEAFLLEWAAAQGRSFAGDEDARGRCDREDWGPGA